MQRPSIKFDLNWEDIAFHIKQSYKLSYLDILKNAYGTIKTSARAVAHSRRRKPHPKALHLVALKRGFLRFLRWFKTPLFIILLTLGIIVYPRPSHIIYADPISPAIKVPHVSDSKPLEETKLAEQAQVASVYVPPPKTVYVAQVVRSSGSCMDWLMATGVSDTASAMTLINRESGCNPWSVNASSGSCNVAQELPCGKSGCSLGDGACSVRWMNGYVLSVYGSWYSALAHSLQYNWY